MKLESRRPTSTGKRGRIRAFAASSMSTQQANARDFTTVKCPARTLLSFLCVLALMTICTVTGSQVARGDLIISEFAAVNGGELFDAQGDASDWIEVYNDDLTDLNLLGWYLTDRPEEPRRWPFPDLVLRPGESLVLFASGKDRVFGEEVHTNFRLSENGEFLGLSDGSAFVSSFAPEYPPQRTGVSFGREGSIRTDVLLSAASSGKLSVPRGPDDDGRASVTDVLHLLRFLFHEGAPARLGRDCVMISGCPEVCP